MSPGEFRLIRRPGALFPLYVVGLEVRAPGDGEPQTLFLNWRAEPGVRAAAKVTGDLSDAATEAVRTLLECRPYFACAAVYRLADTTAGVMGELLEVLRCTLTVDG